jgi:hypothetical protein
MLQRYVRLMATLWWAPLVVYGSVLPVTFTVIWAIAEPANIPAVFQPPELLTHRFVYHILLSILLASHATVLIMVAVRRRMWPSRVLLTNPAEGPDISGSWEFVCTTQGDTFPDGGREHGGTADIQLRQTDYPTAVIISGTTEWKRDKGGNVGPINFPPEWHTQKGFVTGADSFEYEYQTTETGVRQLGYSKLKVFSEEGKPVRLEGQFYNLPPGPPIYGTVKYTKKGMNKSGWKQESGP